MRVIAALQLRAAATALSASPRGTYGMSQAMAKMSSLFVQAEDGIRAADVTGVQTCALPISSRGCPWPCVFCDIPIFNEGKWRSRSPQHVVDEFKHLQALGYGSVYFVDDHFLLQPKRIEAICKGLNDHGITIEWGCEGRVDSVAQHLFPAMAKAHCRTIMFGIESGSQKILDRLKKEQTLAEVNTAVMNAKPAGIAIVHGFFTVGNPDETVEDMQATFDFASRLPLDTFGFNRLCVYRRTRLRS